MQTNYGEEYNRGSMHETARENFLDGKKVIINGKQCKSLIEVMIEDFRLEVVKEHDLLQQSEAELHSKNEIGFLDKFSQTISQGKVTDYLQKRIEEAIKDAKISDENRKKMHKKLKEIGDIDDMCLSDLKIFLRDLQIYKEGINVYQTYGDCVGIYTKKILDSINKLMDEIEAKIELKQNSVEQ